MKPADKDYPFLDIERTRALLRLRLNANGDELAALPDTLEATLATRWRVSRYGRDVEIREGEMLAPEKEALANEWQAYAERCTARAKHLAAEVERMKREE